MFTFSFSTAFAATTYTADEVVAAMQLEAEDYCKLIEAQGTQYIKTGTLPSTTYTVDAAAVKAVVAKVLAEQKTAFLAEVVKLQAAIKGTYDATGRAAAIASVATKYVDNCVERNVTSLDLSIEQFAIEKAKPQGWY